MKKLFSFLLLLISSHGVFSQKVLTAWSQQNIENYTREMYEEAQKLTSSELLNKNLTDIYWSEVFLTLNASVNRHSKDSSYLRQLADQITDKRETKLKGTSRLIIWERIINGDIIFEGKGLVIENDLFKVGGRANQLLQNLTNKNFGFITMHTTDKELEDIKSKWLKYLSTGTVEEYKPTTKLNAKIPEISSMEAVKALITSLHNNPIKQQITKTCLQKVYNLDEMPKEKGVPARYCDPDTYTYSYLGLLFGDKKFDETKDANWWQKFWEINHNKLVWNDDKGFYEVQ